MDGPFSAVRRLVFSVGAVFAGAACAPCALGQVTNVYGIDFMTIGSPGNAPHVVPFPENLSRQLPRATINGEYARPYGGVDYEYGLGRTEITTRQWLDFVNTFSVQSSELANFGVPLIWGGEPDPGYNGPGERYRASTELPGAGNVPVYGFSWRGAAMYCNWLHNGQSADPASLRSGAYDVSTFGNPGGSFSFTDQLRHSPGARFWIPTLDEWVKGVFYDPNRHGEGEGGYWDYHYGRDTELVYGPPGEGMANAGFSLGPNFASNYIPAGSYPAFQSPWGLLDTAGSASEWLEEARLRAAPATGDRRFQAGSSAGLAGVEFDRLTSFLQLDAIPLIPLFNESTRNGLRIATTIPSPAFAGTLLPFCWLVAGRRTRRV